MSQTEYTVKPSAGAEIKLSAGKLATLAAGAVVVQQGGTVVFATATVDIKETKQDFFPLTVEYLEKFYAKGIISGSKVKKREGNPTDSAVTNARMIDHTIRPLFPKAFVRAVNVLVTILADDGQHDPAGLSVLASSAALMESNIPFHGPVATAIVGVDHDDKLVLFPDMNMYSDLKGLFYVSGGHGRVLNIEGHGHEISNEVMDQVLDQSMEYIAGVCQGQEEFVAKIAKTKLEVPEHPEVDQVVDKLLAEHKQEIVDAIYTPNKGLRDEQVLALTTKLVAEMATEESEIKEEHVVAAVDYASKKIMREGVLKEGKRLSGRKLDEIRELSGEVDLLPVVHGSALFNRGITQSLSITTLAGIGKGEMIDEMSGANKFAQFMHHYSFPPFSTGESGRVRYSPGRREIGHGMIGEHGIMAVLPSVEEFPYAIRVVSEIMTSNGSTSMAATCAASMALMAAGVPISKHVGGIGVGLITADEDQKEYKLLLDIEGAEDFYGDMDFKITGTREGLTAIQFETKLHGVRPEILKEAFRMSFAGRQQVLDVMEKAIPAPRAELPPTAPRVEVVRIPQDTIGALIGPGGATVKKIIEDAKAYGSDPLDIKINDDGVVNITAVNADQMAFAVGRVKSLTLPPQIGEIYDAIVDKVMPYGAFVDVNENLGGLVHVSEMSEDFVSDPTQVVKEGQKVRVKLVRSENGKNNFSMKLGSSKPRAEKQD